MVQILHIHSFKFFNVSLRLYLIKLLQVIECYRRLQNQYHTEVLYLLFLVNCILLLSLLVTKSRHLILLERCISLLNHRNLKPECKTLKLNTQDVLKELSEISPNDHLTCAGIDNVHYLRVAAVWISFK